MNLSTALHALLSLAIAGLIWYILWWLFTKLSPPEPFNTVIKWFLYILAAVICIDFLLGFVGHSYLIWKW